MLNTFLISIFFLTASADDLNLMQQGTAAIHQSSVAEIQSVFQVVTDNLREAPNVGKVRKMALDSLMQEVSEKADPEDPARDELLTEIVRLLDMILGDQKNETAADQASLDEIYAAVEACETSNPVDLVDDHQNVTESRKQSHKTCREEELAAWESKEVNCMEIKTMFKALDNCETDSCRFYACIEDERPSTDILANPDLKAAWEAWFFTAASNAQSHATTYNDHKVACVDAIEELSDKVGICETKTRNYEVAQCEWRNVAMTRCSNIETCYDEAIDLQNEKIVNCTNRGNTRWAEMRIVEYIKCLIENLQVEKTDTELCRAIWMDEDTSTQAQENLTRDYNVTIPGNPDAPVCDVGDAIYKPNEVGFTGDGAQDGISGYNVLIQDAKDKGYSFVFLEDNTKRQTC